jgi:hypothetical protein
VPSDCSNCVPQKLTHDGGRIQYGWSIWEWPWVFLEAEHHAVYEGPNGSIEDIALQTRLTGGEKQTSFLSRKTPQPKAVRKK